MKNEGDETSDKKKNEDFLKELASDKTEDLTIKKLTRGNPTMKAKVEGLSGEDK